MEGVLATGGWRRVCVGLFDGRSTFVLFREVREEDELVQGVHGAGGCVVLALFNTLFRGERVHVVFACGFRVDVVVVGIPFAGERD